MEQPIQFRSAFNGFNREDVVHYMEYVNNRHSAQVAQLNNELDYLRGKQTAMDTDRIAELEQQLSSAQSENETLKQRITELEHKCQEAAEQHKPQPMQELEAYRRAERAERLAKERARQIGQQTSDALKEASAQVDDVAGQLAQLSAQLADQLNLLQSTLDSSHEAFQAAYTRMAGLDNEIE